MVKKIYFFLFLLSIDSVLHATDQNKYALLVITPGRTGSSALTGVLKILGLNTGNDFSQGNSANPKGYYENLALVKVNKKIIADLVKNNEKIDSLFLCKRIDWLHHPKRAMYENLIMKGIKEAFDINKTFALKDPRISFLLPLYVSALKKMNYVPKIIVPLREPQEILQSLVKMTKYKDEKLFYIYMSRSLMSILENTENIPTLIIYFNDLLHNTEKVVNKLRTFIPELKTFDESKFALQEFLDKDLKHQKKG